MGNRASEEVTMDMTIDELARRAGTTTRNVRSYQTRGILPPPRMVGRVGAPSIPRCPEELIIPGTALVVHLRKHINAQR